MPTCSNSHLNITVSSGQLDLRQRFGEMRVKKLTKYWFLISAGNFGGKDLYSDVEFFSAILHVGRARMKRYFAIGDIHGCLSELQLLISELPLKDDDTIVFLGDYIDRGDSSKEVIDFIINLKQERNVIALSGNHEILFLNFLFQPDSNLSGTFFINGGSSTLASYGDRYGEYVIPENHVTFLRSLPYWYETDDYFFVHGGVPDKPLADLDPNKDRLFVTQVREEFFNSDFDWGKTIVHGHTPVAEPFISDKRINVDTKCVFNGKLTAIELPSKKIYSVEKQVPYKHTYLKDHSSTRRAVRFETHIPVKMDHVDDELTFHTVNFSDFGMLVQCDGLEQVIFNNNSKVSGVVGDNRNYFRFSGEVVRTLLHEGSMQYAISFEKSPLEID